MSKTSIERLCGILHKEADFFKNNNSGGREMMNPIKQVCNLIEFFNGEILKNF